MASNWFIYNVATGQELTINPHVTQSTPFTTSAVQFSGDSVMTSVPPGTTTSLDYTIPSNLFPTGAYITGGVLIGQNSIFGDYVQAQVIDVNNVLGFGANFVVATYINKFFVQVPQTSQATAIMEHRSDYAAMLPPGLVLRITYTSTADPSTGTAVNIAINYFLHAPVINTVAAK